MRNTMAYRSRLPLTCVLSLTFCLLLSGATSLVALEKAPTVAPKSASASAVVSTLPTTTISKDELHRHVTKLASEEFKGRNPAGEGGILAAHYIAGEFKKLGLEPAGDEGDDDGGGYFQSFSLTLPGYARSSKDHGSAGSTAVSTSNPDESSGGNNADDDPCPPMSEEEIQEAAKKLNRWLGDKAREFFQSKECQCRNVLGLLPGSDPELKDEVIVVSAHYDHLGVRGSEVYNGADDNASGVATMLEIARVLKSRPQAPRRSILFAAWDAEEKGLCGSYNWTNNPTLPLDQVVAVVNIDMVGRMREDRLTVLGVESSTQLNDIITARAKRAKIRFKRWENCARSDHWPFYVAEIPCLTFCTGTHKDYHKPTDDVEWIHFADLTRIARMSLGIVIELASRDEPVRFTGEVQEDK